MEIRRISNAFQERSVDFKDLETDIAIFRNSFFSAKEVPQKYQMELIKLKVQNFS